MSDPGLGDLRFFCEDPWIINDHLLFYLLSLVPVGALRWYVIAANPILLPIAGKRWRLLLRNVLFQKEKRL